jgi:hypothetical protein
MLKADSLARGDQPFAGNLRRWILQGERHHLM